MKYRRFLFDLDDTLLDFKASEQLSLQRMLDALQMEVPLETLFPVYQRENLLLWQQLEAGSIDKESLKVERFRRTFAGIGMEADAHLASTLYLEFLPQTVVLVDGAEALCRSLASIGEIGIITNGIESVQTQRIASSGLADTIAFVATSEACGYAKPDVRLFEYSAARFGSFSKHDTLIVGDRLEADVLGANRYGIDSCWFNPLGAANTTQAVPTLEIAHLDHLHPALRAG